MLADESSAQGEEDENYFVSMTDMMVGILFVFIIMLMVFALNFREKTDQQQDKVLIAEQLAKQIAALQVDIKSQVSILDQADAAKLQLLADIKERLKKQGLVVDIDETNGVLRLTENAIRFGSSKFDLDAVARANVQKIARVLAETLPAYTQCADETVCLQTAHGARLDTVFIEGHTDFTGDERSNWTLSVQRAVETYLAIVDTAPSLRSLRNNKQQEILSVSGYGPTRPISAARSGPQLGLNRRIDLRFVMEADERTRLRRVVELLEQMESKIEELGGSNNNSTTTAESQ